MGALFQAPAGADFRLNAKNKDCGLGVEKAAKRGTEASRYVGLHNGDDIRNDVVATRVARDTHDCVCERSGCMFAGRPGGDNGNST